jgi:flagellar basal-body rod modification protein FlgD
MNVTRSTKAFGETQPEIKSKTSEGNSLGAQDIAKLNGEDLGSVLNKVSDSNWIDPSKKMRTAGNPNLDKEAFFKLMFTQMKHQDPMNPMKSHEMSAQLAQFSSLEQMQNMNATLSEIKNGQKPAEQFQALSLIGKSVAGDSSQVVRSKEDKEHDFRFTLTRDAAEVEVKVRDSEGNIVRTYNLRNLKEGENKITWNGQDEFGNSKSPGEYVFVAEAKGLDGKKIAMKTDFDGVITGINFSPEGPVLLVGNQSLRLRDVRKIVDPATERKLDPMNDQKINDVTNQGLKKEEKKNENKEIRTAGNGVPTKLMQELGMSSSFMSKLAKEASN